MSPIHPDAENKRIVVGIFGQTLFCFEGNTEIHFARNYSGALYEAWGNRVDACATPDPMTQIGPFVGASLRSRMIRAISLSNGRAGQRSASKTEKYSLAKKSQEMNDQDNPGDHSVEKIRFLAISQMKRGQFDHLLSAEAYQ